MPNVVGNYDPVFYSNEALIWLRKRLGFARRVHRALEAERNRTFRKGSKVETKRPRTFTAEDHVEGVGSAAQDLATQDVEVQLNVHKEVKFRVTDRERAYTGDEIITNHIQPATHAIAKVIDEALYALASKVGPANGIQAHIGGNLVSKMYTQPKQVLFNNDVDTASPDIHYLVDGYQQARFEESEIFHAARIAGQDANSTLFTGTLGTRFGVQTFASQLAGQATTALAGTVCDSGAGGDRVGAIDGAASPVPVNTASVTIDGLTDTQTVVAGNTFTIAGDPTVYTCLTGGTVTGTAVTVSIYPGLQKETADNAVVTFDLQLAEQEVVHYENLMFHRDAFGLIMVPLPEDGNEFGAKIATVTDPQTGLAIRTRMWYEGATTYMNVAMDALFGVEVMNSQLAVRAIRSTQ